MATPQSKLIYTVENYLAVEPATANFPPISNAQRQPGSDSFPGSKAGDEREPQPAW